MARPRFPTGTGRAMTGSEPWLTLARRALMAWLHPSPLPAPAPRPLPTPSPSGAAIGPEGRGFLSPTRFEGTLAGHGKNVPVTFEARIDALGVLHLHLDTMRYSPAAGALHIHQRPGSPVDLQLIGESAAGHRFRSDSFSITRYRHGSDFELQGDCYDAEIDLSFDPSHDTSQDTRAWRVRQLATLRRIAHDTPLGRVIMGGPRQDQESQDPDGFIAVHRPKGDMNPNWWEESEQLLTHVARVLSFARDSYLRPVIEERYDQGKVTIRIARHGRASTPYMTPFHSLDMQPIFVCACETFFTRHDEIEELDAAIRWLTAPVAYDESRLINAVSALENILARCDIEQIDFFLENAEFKKVAKAVRAALKTAKAPEEMTPKVSELNRRALGQKVEALLSVRGIVHEDFPDSWLATVIKQRNVIVHTGVSPECREFETDTIDHTIWAREIVTRIILERLGFTGGFRSWLHGDEQLRFPECIAMETWVCQQEAIAAEEKSD